MNRDIFSDTALAVTISTTRQSGSEIPQAYIAAIPLNRSTPLPESLVACLQFAAERATSNDIRFVDGAKVEKELSYAELLEEGQRVLGGLRAASAKPGECVLFQLETPAEILPAFWGCALGGFVPVIAQVASLQADAERAHSQLDKIWEMLQRPLVVSSRNASLRSNGEPISAVGWTTREIAFTSLLASAPCHDYHQAAPDDLALLSLTSGSTGVPKAVELTHRNLISRAAGANVAGHHQPTDVALNWLPLDHIGSISDWHVRCVLLGCKTIYARKEDVLGNPLRWLELIDRYRVTHTWAPNFAYSLILDAEKNGVHEWDLSCVKAFLTAGENIAPGVACEFVERLAKYGARRNIIRPAFGMAETGSGVSYRCASDEENIKVVHVARESLGGPLTLVPAGSEDGVGIVSLGPPIPGAEVRVVGDDGHLCSELTVGQVHFRGEMVARGYYQNPEASLVFRADGWLDTGDLGFIHQGELYLAGRAKDTIIIHGANFSGTEIEGLVETIDGVKPSFTAACAVRRAGQDEALAIFFVTDLPEPEQRAELLRAIRRRVVREIGINPTYLLPVTESQIPKTAIGKIQRRQLCQQFEQGSCDRLWLETQELLRVTSQQQASGQPITPLERLIADILQTSLGLDFVSIDQNVFELGAHSLLMIQIHHRLETALDRKLSVIEMFKYPTVRELAAFLSGKASIDSAVKQAEKRAAMRRRMRSAAGLDGVAVIGMACRYPGANNLAEFWNNLRGGVESISQFTNEQVIASGVDPQRLRDPKYVSAGPVLRDVELFDAEFFGYSAREAELMDPQQRLFLECMWEAMEDAGHNLLAEDASVGVFAGAMLNTYLLNNVFASGRFLADGERSSVLTPDSLGGFLTMVGNDKDYLTTRASYKLNLRGPSVNVQTACSTSLVAIHMAAESILAGGCDLAFAGGVSVKVPQESGYLYEDDLIVSPDGHCRPFDSEARGTVFGNGCGVVLLKRLDQAIADRDHIYCVIRGSATNNDGGKKVGYMAPSQDGQSSVLAESLAIAGISPDDVGLLEAHGTGTTLGDPIEVAAMTQAFRASTDRKGFCVLGSVKGNVGHLQIASGVVGFMKAALSVHRGEIPPSVNFQSINPKIDLNETPFTISTQPIPWKSDKPRVAGVNSLGIGGSNAHVIVQQAPASTTAAGTQHGHYLLALSAKNEKALRELAGRYLRLVEDQAAIHLGNLCFTANTGRVHHAVRAGLVFSDPQELQELLQQVVQTGKCVPEDSGVDMAELDVNLLADSPTLDSLNSLAGYQSLARLYVAGHSIDWLALYAGFPGSRIPLPTYPFQRKRFWIDAPQRQLANSVTLLPAAPATSGWLSSCQTSSANQVTRFDLALSLAEHPLLREHKVNGQVVAPGVLSLCLLNEAVQVKSSSEPVAVRNLRFLKPFVLEEALPTPVRISLNAAGDPWRSVRIESGIAANGASTLVSTGEVLARATADFKWSNHPAKALSEKLRGQPSVGHQEFYKTLEGRSVQLGQAFRAIQSFSQTKAEGLAAYSASVSTDQPAHTLALVALDVALQAGAKLLFADQEHGATSSLYPVGIGSFTLLRPVATTGCCFVQLSRNETQTRGTVDAYLLDDNFEPVAIYESIEYQWIETQDRSLAAAQSPATQGNGSYNTPVRVQPIADSKTPIETRLGTGQPDAGNQLIPHVTLQAANADRLREMIELVREEACKSLGLAAGTPVALDRGFMELGLDSLTSVEMRNRLQKRLSLQLPATLLFDAPTCGQLASRLCELLVAETPSTPAAANQLQTDQDSNTRPQVSLKPSTENRITQGERSMQPHDVPGNGKQPANGRANANGHGHTLRSTSERLKAKPPVSPARHALRTEPVPRPVKSKRQEPLAIVGLACRFPGGANDAETFWQILQQGRSTISEIPGTRFDIDRYYDADRSIPGKIATRHGSFLDNVHEFDAQFFGMSAREAVMLDPQQRLLLEVTYEALENAGLRADKLEGTNAGVFIGISSVDYCVLASQHIDKLDAYFGTGTSHSTASGRLSYFLGLQGPSMSIDTACSSSLVAMHLACQSICNGESELAIVGGVNLVIMPEIMVSFSKAQMLSSDGRCKTFDAAADGYVRGEGVGVVIVKRLSAAIRDNDQILAVVRGTAVNQDGKSSGLTVPSGAAQEKVIRAALRAAQLEPEQVSYVEAHGTGTPLGDSIELAALKKAYGSERTEPLWVGSVKSNIGHTEAASGMAGLIKVILAIQHQTIPPHLNFETPNVNVDWDGLTVPMANVPWNTSDGSRIAGVSSFGFGGTNAHVILEQPSTRLSARAGSVQGAPRAAQVLVLSAKSSAALTALAKKTSAAMEQLPASQWIDLCSTAALRRHQLSHRAAVVAANPEDAQRKLRALVAGQVVPGLVSGEVVDLPGKLAMMFTGQGSQYVGMGRELYNTESTFRRTLDKCDELLRPYMDRSLLSLLYPQPGETSPIDQTEYTQPALFSIEYSLWELWCSWGIKPAVVFGHSVGEYVAACIAGVFSLEDALRLISARARLMQSLPPAGAMSAIMGPLEFVEKEVEQRRACVGIAAVNGPKQIVISGETHAVSEIEAAASQHGIRTKRLVVSHAFHSHLLDPILDDFLTVASSIEYKTPDVPLISNLTGQMAGDEIGTPEYWCQHLRHAVQFVSSVQTAVQAGCSTFLEVGPRATLSTMAKQCVDGEHTQFLASLSGQDADWPSLLGSLASLHVAGHAIEWNKLYDGRTPYQPVLPTYPFQRKRYWVADNAQATRPVSSAVITSHPSATCLASGHPLVGQSKQLPKGIQAHDIELDLQRLDYLNDHCVRGQAVFPAAGYIESFVAAARKALATDAIKLTDVEFSRPLPLASEHPTSIQMTLSQEAKTFRAEFYRVHENGHTAGTQFTLHSQATLAAGESLSLEIDLESVFTQTSTEIVASEFYRSAAASGLEYGPQFQGLVELHAGEQSALCRWLAGDTVRNTLNRYILHPSLLDAAFQTIGVAIHESLSGTYLPIGIGEMVVYDSLPEEGWCYARLESNPGDPNQIIASLTLSNLAGRVLAKVSRFRLQRVGGGTASSRVEAVNSQGATRPQAPTGLHQIKWMPMDVPMQPPTSDIGTWLIIGDQTPTSRELAQRLRDTGFRSVEVHYGPEFAHAEIDRFSIDCRSVPDAKKLLEEVTDEFLPPLQGVIFLAASGNNLGSNSQTDATPDAQGFVRGVLHLAQGLQSCPKTPADLKFMIVTTDTQTLRDGQAAKLDCERLHFSQLWSLTGVIAGEQASWSCARLDLDGNGTVAESVDAIVSELWTSSSLEQVAYRDGQRFVARLQRCETLDAAAATALQARPEGPFRLQLSEYGVIENLQLAQIKRRTPGEGEVEIEVAASGLNFRDVLRALGMLQSYEAPLGITCAAVAPFGFECAGRVVAVGPGVTRFTVGQEVVGVASGSMASHVITSAGQISGKPAELTMREAATIPLPFLTASYALESLAEVRPGQRVLIHAAAGGVGVAAVQIAQRLGAEVWATASQSKWPLLRSMGVKHLFNSRSTDFAAKILAATGGEGVDVVLNSLTGDFIAASVDCVKAGGSFVEIGKIGIWSAGEMARKRPDIRYFAFDLGEEESSCPGLMGRMLDKLLPRFATGELRPLPTRVFPIEQAAQAFRFVAQAKHRGKVVLDIIPTSSHVKLRSDLHYLISGGLGALGLITADWLADHGARRLLLLGRSEPSESQSKAITALRTRGIEVGHLRVDVTDRDGLANELACYRGQIGGVVHAAGLLQDGMLAYQSWERFERVLEPKVLGGWNLHELTQDEPLEFFVCYSSAAAVLGSPGQSNYAAANAHLDALCQYRRNQGQVALSINWGPWSEGGMAARLDARQRNRLADMGLGLIDTELGKTLLEQAMLRDSAQVVAMDIDWTKFARHNRPSSLWRDLVAKPADASSTDVAQPVEVAVRAKVDVQVPSRTIPQAVRQENASRSGAASTSETAGATAEVVAKIGKAPAGKRRALLIEYLRGEIAAVLGFDAQSVSPRGRLFDLGMDSLTAVELQNRLKRSLGVELPATLAFDYPTVDALANFMMDQLQLDKPASTPSNVSKEIPPTVEASSFEENAAQYSDDQIEKLLREKYQVTLDD